MTDRRRLPVLADDAPEPEVVDAHADALAAMEERAQVTRRAFLSSVGAAGAATLAAGCSGDVWEGFFQQHYQRMTASDRAEVIARLEEDSRERYGIDSRISDLRPLPGVEYGYALNVSLCTGCRRCEYACAEENNQSRDPEIHYIRVLELPKGTINLEEANAYYEGEVPKPDHFYLPVQCHQCANPPCVTACPVQATWKDEDGIVVIDYDWCIGCRYCMAACPYGARHFNFSEPNIAPSEINTDQGYMSNRIRPVGVVEKCHFCLHRVRRGLNPACLEVCPVGARKFGNLLDPNSSVRQVLETKRVYILKEELGTLPRFFYYFD